ncbi:hypothetical protein HDU91_003811, partial [Kappamyces sp. JEL0680]
MNPLSASPIDSSTTPVFPARSKGRQKREIKYLQNKSSRQDSFYKRKTGIMKKAHELAVLTGNQLLLLATSETGHIYVYATEKFQPLFSHHSQNPLFSECLASIGVEPRQLADSNMWT